MQTDQESGVVILSDKTDFKQPNQKREKATKQSLNERPTKSVLQF